MMSGNHGAAFGGHQTSTMGMSMECESADAQPLGGPTGELSMASPEARRPQFQPDSGGGHNSTMGSLETLVGTEYGVGAIVNFDPLAKLFLIRLNWGAEVRIHQDKVRILPHRCPSIQPPMGAAAGFGGPCSEADGRGQKRRPSAEPSLGGIFGDATALPQGPSSKRSSNDMMFYQNMSGAQNVGIPQLSGSNYAPTLNLSSQPAMAMVEVSPSMDL